MDVVIILPTFTSKTPIFHLDLELNPWGQLRNFWFAALWRDVLETKA